MEHEKGSEAAGSQEIVEPVVVGRVDDNKVDIYNEINGPEAKVTEITRELEVKQRPQVDWGIPFDEVAYSSWMIHMMAERAIRPSDGLITTESTYVVQARNYIHNRYINHSEMPYLMMVDSDVLIPRDGLDQLIEISQEHDDKAVVSGWYHQKQQGDPVPAVYKVYSKEKKQFLQYLHSDIKENFLKGKATRVAGVAAGCMLMPRGVAEQLGEDPYQYRTDDQPLGEDMMLCRSLSGLKIDILVYWPLLCRHLGVGYI